MSVARMAGFRRALRRGMAWLDAAAGLRGREAERGGATVEFVILLPAFLLVFISSFEASILLTRQVMLERAVDIAVREVRLDIGSGVGQGQLRRSVCGHARILPDCDENLLIEMTEIDTGTFALPEADAPCVDRLTSVVPRATFSSDREGKMILLRACFAVKPALPFSMVWVDGRTLTALASDLVSQEDGSIRMVTATAFVVEAN